MPKENKDIKLPPPSVCDVFEKGCMYCANKKPSIFNPENYPQKMHVAEMAYHSNQGTLYVRETTAEVEKQPGDDYNPPPEKKKAPEVQEEEPPEPILPNNFKGLKQSCSGITFIEEKEELEREIQYYERLTKKLQERKVWKEFRNHMERFKKFEQLKLVKPAWYQELSSNQINQLERLPTILKSDLDEKSTINTKRFLNDLGVFPIPETKYIEKALADCELDPLYFLIRMQKEVGILEEKQKNPVKEITDFEIRKRKYTACDRIIYSAISHMHMPILLFKLHLMLPPPAPGQFGKYKNFMEPLPMPDQVPHPVKEWFLSNKSGTAESVLEYAFADDKASKNDPLHESPSLWTVSNIPLVRERKSNYFGIEVNKTKEVQGTIAQHQDTHQPPMKSEDGKPIDDNGLYPSFQSFFQGLSPSESTYFIMESFTQTNISFHTTDNLVRQISKNLEYDSETEKVEEEVSELLTVLRNEKTEKPQTKTIGVMTDPQWLPHSAAQEVVDLLGEDYIREVVRRSISERPYASQDQEMEDVIANLIASIIKRPTEYEIMRKQKLKECIEQNNIDGLYDIFEVPRPGRKVSTNVIKKTKKGKSSDKKTKKISNTSQSTLDVNVSKNTNNEELQTDIEEELEKLIIKIRNDIKKKPIECQLKFCLKILSLAGDPLANFPDLVRHPVLQRWFDLRIGLKRKLSEKEKAKLMERSKGMWDALRTSVVDIKVPKVNIPPKQLARFTWDKREWVKKKVEKIMQQFQHEVRLSLIEDARALYPTMFTQYYDSKLNKNLREVFFTYLPAKENDVFVFRPWRPSEIKHKK